MAIVKTARKLEIGDEILSWANTEEEHDEFEKRVESARKELKALPEGSKSITFLMRKKYRDAHSQNSKILYKRSVRGFYPASGSPDYKDNFLKFNWGMIRTSNFEEIAFLDMHFDWFVREANRELSPMEKMTKEIEELKAKLEVKEKPKEEPKEITFDPIAEAKEEIKEEKEKKEKRKKKKKKRKVAKNGGKSEINAGEEPANKESDSE